MKFLVPNYSCLQNPWQGDYHPQIPVLSVLNWICWNPPPRKKIPGYAAVLDFGITWWWVVTFELRPPYPRKKNRQYATGYADVCERHHGCWRPVATACPPAAGTGLAWHHAVSCLNIWRSWVLSWQEHRALPSLAVELCVARSCVKLAVLHR